MLLVQEILSIALVLRDCHAATQDHSWARDETSRRDRWSMPSVWETQVGLGLEYVYLAL